MSEIGSVLQWNMGCRSKRRALPVDAQTALRCCKLLVGLIEDYQPTFIAAQETPRDCLDYLRKKLARKYQVVSGARSGLITLYSTGWSISEPHINKPRVMLCTLIRKSTGARVRFWNVHLWSKLMMDSLDVANKVRGWVNHDVIPPRLEAGDDASEIFVGDFNMTPYAMVITEEGSLWARQSLPWTLTAERGVRRNPSKNMHRRLFNPSWELVGRYKHPLGTFYYTKRPTLDGPWYVTDQILMSPVHGFINKRHTMILGAEAGATQLWSDRHIRSPDSNIGSDHYPVLVKIKLS